MSKEIKIQLTISYDKIRQHMCLINGRILEDSEIEEVVNGGILFLETNIFGEGKSKEELEQLLSIFVLTKIMKKDTEEIPKRSKFQERLEVMKQNKNS